MKRAGVSAVIGSWNDRANLERCLTALCGTVDEVIVADSASTDGTTSLVRSRFPSARLIELPVNRGYGAAVNAGIAAAEQPYLLLLNSDAWPLADAVDHLVELAEQDPTVGVIGPRLQHPDGTLQRSVRGFPTLWRIATEFLFLRKVAPGTRALNAFYAANFDHQTACDAEFLRGAALLVRREAIEQVGAFDETYFVFSEDVDLCYRMRRGGWRVVFLPAATFVHVGGASTIPQWTEMFKEQIRGHMLFFAKYSGLARAERARRIMLLGLRVRGVAFRGERRRTYRQAAAWLASVDTRMLVGNIHE
jgi:GT2 family glycosyltransferase